MDERHPPETILARRKKASRRAAPQGEPAIPPAFVARMESLLGDESEAFFGALAHERGGLRVNTLRASPSVAARQIPFALSPLPGLEEGFTLNGAGRPGVHPYHHAGLFYLQDPSAMMVGRLMDPQPGEWVADLAAAPGGKSTHLIARMRDTGFLLANDPHPLRARELAGNLERWGARNVAVSVESVARLAERLGDVFDRVLLDAPCSGEAMFLKSAAAGEAWSAEAVAGCARRQEGLLSEAAGLVRPGGLLVYSTCTFSPEEDERVIGIFLRERPDFSVEAAPAVPGAAPGRPEWVEPEFRAQGLEQAVRLWPHRVPGAGHFVVLLRRQGGGERHVGSRSAAGGDPLLERWLADHLPALTVEDVDVRGDEIFAPPPHSPPLDGLRVLRPGLWLGSRRRDRFEPAHALAMALRPPEPGRSLDLVGEDPRVRAFLRGETLEAPGEPGWLVVRVDGYPLGWGKRVGATVKNHLPRGLRSQR
jgi:16S rRNA C967 or C1407 C5-methylase (RsmB/RsmF family)/NOL1/NOP2/fmu family ribosome biogenesis protein